MATEAYKLAELFQRSALIRETAFDWKKCADDYESTQRTAENYYTKTLYEAVVEACGTENYHYVELIHPSLYSAWNDVLDWAKSITGKDLPPIENPDKERFLASTNPVVAEAADNVNTLTSQGAPNGSVQDS